MLIKNDKVPVMSSEFDWIRLIKGNMSTKGVTYITEQVLQLLEIHNKALNCNNEVHFSTKVLSGYSSIWSRSRCNMYCSHKWTKTYNLHSEFVFGNQSDHCADYWYYVNTEDVKNTTLLGYFSNTVQEICV